MTHELKQIFQQALNNQKAGSKNVLATVVALDGSSYRRPGVRMLISENGEITGAISGGCVEMEVLKQAQSVFKTNQAKIMTYDGRYRLGCEGTLYILLEILEISEKLWNDFKENLKERNPFEVNSYYKKTEAISEDFGSEIIFKNNKKHSFSFSFQSKNSENLLLFSQKMQPCFKLLLIGAKHDAVKLCKMASLLGWEVDVVTSLKDSKQISDFPGAQKVLSESPETINFSKIDAETAVVLMTHNYAIDLSYLGKLQKQNPLYIGILGSSKRRDRLENDLLEYAPEIALDFFEKIHSPAGLNIGAETPEEIALSILSEILSVTRKKQPFSLKEITGKVH